MAEKYKVFLSIKFAYNTLKQQNVQNCSDTGSLAANCSVNMNNIYSRYFFVNYKNFG